MAVSSSPLRVVLADADPVFLAGLAQGLAAYGDLEISALAAPRDLLALDFSVPPDLLVLDPGADWSICRRWQAQYPACPVLLLTARGEGRSLRWAKNLGIAGYCPKGRPIAEIYDQIRGLAQGETLWLLPPPPFWLPLVQPGFQELLDQQGAIARHLETELSPVARWYWAGRLRELNAARALAQGLLPALRPTPLSPVAVPAVMAPPAPPAIANASAWDLWWQSIAPAMTQPLRNGTDLPLELEFLLPEYQQQLCGAILTELDRLRQELKKQPDLTPEQLRGRLTDVMLDWWENSAIAFLRPHYRWLPSDNNRPLGELLQGEKPLMAAYLAPPQPWIAHLWCSWIWDEPFPVDQTPYRATSPEAIARLTPLGQHLVIQVANGVVGAIVNHFGEASPLGQRLYQPQWRSSRALARFRNDLSWRYWTERHWREPQHIFDSCYQVFALRGTEIRRQTIPWNRSPELNALQGWPWLLTILWELRDLLAPRTRRLLAILGRGLVYVLTQVLGRALGLVGRGILDGLGQGWQQPASLRQPPTPPKSLQS